MADVRSLLRQQRAARRIAHPHAAYSDAGKLLCTVCHEQVKAESLWDSHTRSAAHIQRLEKLQASKPPVDQPSTSNKRKHDDEHMDDASMGDADEDGLRKKRSRHNVQEEEQVGPDASTAGKGRGDDGDYSTANSTPMRTKPATPPLPRRTSGTPSHGVEVQLPSRPATPVALRTEFSGAINGNGPAASRSPLRPQREHTTVAGFVSAAEGAAEPIEMSSAAVPPPVTGATVISAGAKQGQDVDEDEWAAFEADLLHSNTNGTATSTSRPGIPAAPADAVISAPVMTADELAARSAEEERERRRLTADIDLDNEKEDATRALEEEFEEMEELEARVRRLKERREALRQHQGSPPVTAAAAAAAGSEGDKYAAGAGGSDGKENVGGVEESDDEDEDEDEDEDPDDWAGFRFKG